MVTVSTCTLLVGVRGRRFPFPSENTNRAKKGRGKTIPLSRFVRSRIMMEKGNLSRRGFMQRSLATLTAAGLPMWYAREVFAHEQQTAAQNQRPVQANDRIVMAAIGTGTNRTRRRNDSERI